MDRSTRIGVAFETSWPPYLLPLIPAVTTLTCGLVVYQALSRNPDRVPLAAIILRGVSAALGWLPWRSARI